MKGDFSRITFSRKKHYVKVNMQQGRVQTDADWNEQSDINNHNNRISLQEIIGESGTAVANDGFKIQCSGDSFKIKRGRYYVNGILCENEEDVGADNQPDLPSFDKSHSILPNAPGNYLVYLDVWERHITYLDDPQIRDVALGGHDTTTRTKVIWQVKLLRVENTENEMNCHFPIEEWGKITKASTGTLLPRLNQSTLENHLYRVEIHEAGKDDHNVTFKWSKDNGSIVTKLTDISGQELFVEKLLPLKSGEWIEIIDDYHELWNTAGTLVKLASVEGNRLIYYPDSIKGDALNEENYPQKFNPKVQKWDSNGCLKVERPPNNDGYIELDDGVEIKFDDKGSFHTGDYWVFPARTVIGDTEPLRSCTPQGPRHHYCPLALIQKENKNIKLLSDLRHFFSSNTVLTTHRYAHSGMCSDTVEAGAFKIIGPIYHNASETVTTTKSIPPAIILGKIDTKHADKEEDISDLNTSVNDTRNQVRHMEDFVLLTVLNKQYGFVPKEDHQNPSGLTTELGLDRYLDENNSIKPMFFRPVYIDLQKFYILVVNYDNSQPHQFIKIRWWAIPAISSDLVKQELQQKSINI